jgi:hypothetical protein
VSSEAAQSAENPELAQARYLLHHLHTAAVDVLLLGESTLLYVGPDEADQRSVGDLLVENLEPAATYTVAGPGYGIGLHAEFVRLASSMPARPVVVHTLYVRGTYPAFIDHPQYGHRRGLGLLRAAEATGARHLRAAHRAPTPEEYLAYEQVPYPTLVDERRVIGDFMAPLRHDLEPGEPEHTRWLFEFHYGGSPTDEGLQAFTDIGRRLRDCGYPVVAFQNPVNVVQGCQVLGAEFGEWHARNERAVLDAYRAGIGDDAVILETSALWQPEDFVDPALEHLAAPARVRLAEIVADEVRRVAELEESAA